jgi:hypothetical protein
MTQILCKDWRELSEAASQEKDPQKLLELIEQLNKVLDQREQDSPQYRPPNQQASRNSSGSTLTLRQRPSL